MEQGLIQKEKQCVLTSNLPLKYRLKTITSAPRRIVLVLKPFPSASQISWLVQIRKKQYDGMKYELQMLHTLPNGRRVFIRKPKAHATSQ